MHQRKYRQKYNKFIAEGPKICMEFLRESTYFPEYIFATAEWIEQNEQLSRTLPQNRIIKVKQKELDQISLLKSAGASLYGVKSIPTTFLIGRDGTIAALNPRNNLEDQVKKFI